MMSARLDRPSWPAFVILLAFLLNSEEAAACRAFSSQTTVFFNAVPADLEVQVIARVTVTSMIGEVGDILPRGWSPGYVGIAHVDEVIKGPIAAPAIELVSPAYDCDMPFGTGSTGIVLGTLERNDNGMLVLNARSRFNDPSKRGYPQRP
jgi:hypothetical protein